MCLSTYCPLCMLHLLYNVILIIIFLFCFSALSTTIALIIYPIAIAMDDSIHSHTYGSGYGLGWGGTAFFFAASLCMSLDELVRESSQNKCCRYLCWRRRNDRGEHPVWYTIRNINDYLTHFLPEFYYGLVQITYKASPFVLKKGCVFFNIKIFE